MTRRKQPLPETFYPTKHTTIGAVIEAGLHIHAYCLSCRWHDDVDLRAVAEKLGPDQSSLPMHLVPRLVCSQCGGKDIATMLKAGENKPPQEHVGEAVRHQRRKDEDQTG